MIRPQLLFVAVFIVGFLIAARKLKHSSPRTVQRVQRLVFCILLLLLLPVIVQLHAGQADPALFLVMVLVVLSVAYPAFRSLSAHEHLQNFALDNARCGRCAYDLTGNVMGVCPECGWTVPQGPVVAESPDWLIWWNGWEIPHLDNWRRRLFELMAMVLLFGALTGWMVSRGSGLALLPFLMCVHFAINAIRVVSYASRQGQTQG